MEKKIFQKIKNNKKNARRRKNKVKSVKEIENRALRRFKICLAVEFSLTYQLDCIVKYNVIETLCKGILKLIHFSFLIFSYFIFYKKNSPNPLSTLTGFFPSGGSNSSGLDFILRAWDFAWCARNLQSLKLKHPSRCPFL